jgi:hypothetical protein
LANANNMEATTKHTPLNATADDGPHRSSNNPVNTELAPLDDDATVNLLVPFEQLDIQIDKGERWGG